MISIASFGTSLALLVALFTIRSGASTNLHQLNLFSAHAFGGPRGFLKREDPSAEQKQAVPPVEDKVAPPQEKRFDLDGGFYGFAGGPQQAKRFELPDGFYERFPQHKRFDYLDGFYGGGMGPAVSGFYGAGLGPAAYG